MRPSSLAVIGLGAIGGSLAWQARLAGVRRVIGFSPDRGEGIEALRASAVTELADSPTTAVRGAQLVILAAPPQPTLELIAALATRLDNAALLSDVCSIKAAVVKQAQSAGISDRFAGAHPLAGTHETGFQSARPDRLRGCIVYICESGSPRGHRAADAIAGFWERTLEASPVRIDAENHDRQLAWTSHLPQALACALSRCLAQHSQPGISYGSGAKDTTRLAASDPDMWTDILLHNAVAVGAALERTESQMSQLRQLLTRGDAAGLLSYLRDAQAFRRGMDR
ncbi:MAG TPA: prephenate dehydrogenase [Gemmatimonadales bacterium]|nr:prephenate dehydrogenase [Gemmatimonadales bacterium]